MNRKFIIAFAGAVLFSAAVIAQERSTLVVTAVGDVMLGSGWGARKNLPPDDGAQSLTAVRQLISLGDIRFGNLEGPLADTGDSNKCASVSPRCFAFRVPTRYGKYLKEAGFNVMSLANNHALDFGEAGRQSTQQVLDELGIAHSGAIGDVARMKVRGKLVAVVAFATYDGSNNLLQQDEAVDLVRRLVAEGATVVVSFHGGGEGLAYQHVPRGVEFFLGENRGNLRAFTHAVIDAGAALVLGHGPHVVRGMEIYCGRLIAYSLGNFATYGQFNLSAALGQTLVLEARLADDGTFLGGKIHPVKQIDIGIPIPDDSGAIIPLVRTLSQQNFADRAVVVGDDGVLAPPAAPSCPRS